ncbi:MAG: radical SAM protein [Desulfobacterales bacterium]|nr:radical SAM protein [Desulfobacterales bacterium]
MRVEIFNSGCSKKKRIYLNEYNVLMGNTTYLPFVSGLLQAYAHNLSEIISNYQFMPFIFYRDSVERILSKYDDPAIAAFSVSMWNEQISLKVAERVKFSYPNCLIIFGGPQVPHHPHNYFRQYPFIDVAVRGEGESAFADILIRFIETTNFSNIPSIAWRHPDSGICVLNNEERTLILDIDRYPSPYLDGIFDNIMKERNDLNFQCIIETNRGCPFKCTYCFWGQGGLSRKYRFHSLERIAAEIDWFGRNKISYVFNADSNFAMHSRDMKIAEILVEAKKKYGYPEKFRACYGKNTDKRIFQIIKLLHMYDIDKGITLSRQSNNLETLKNVRRQNIKMSVYQKLQKMCNKEEIPVYTEFILGLPGENYKSWVEGIGDILDAGLQNQLFIYQCQVLPNTEMADTEYQKRFGIRTKRVRLHEIHGSIHSESSIPEYEEIIISTKSMPLAEWFKMTIFSWTTMLMHSLKVGFYIILYLKNRFGVHYIDFIRYFAENLELKKKRLVWSDELTNFSDKLDCILKGEGRGNVLSEFGMIYWDEEEASFLRINKTLDLFYNQMLSIIEEFLLLKHINFDKTEVKEAVLYQKLRMPRITPIDKVEWIFTFNFPEYFDNLLLKEPIFLVAKTQILTVYPRDFGENPVRYAQEIILRGRKSGNIIEKVLWK